METTRSATRSSAPAIVETDSSGARGWRPAAATVSMARVSSRTSSVAVRQPSSARASSTDAAVAPPPITTAERTGSGTRSTTADTAPGTSVLKPVRRRLSSRTVLAAPASCAHSSSESTSGTTALFSGIVSDSPRQVASSDSTKARSPEDSISTASYVQSSPRCLYAARCSAGDNECVIGDPRTAQRMLAGSAVFTGLAVLLQLRDPLLVLGVRRGEAGGVVLVVRDEVEPVAVRRVERGLDRLLARRPDRPGRQPGVLVGVVRRGVRPLRRSGPHIAGTLAHVGNGRVQLQRHVLLHPVVEHPRDLRIVLRLVRLVLEDARHGQDLLGSEAQRLRLRLDVEGLLGLHALGHHLRDQAEGVLLGRDRVRRREQVALGVALGLGREPDGVRLGQGSGHRTLADVGLGHDRLHDVAHPCTLRYDDQVLHQVLRVHQHGQRLAGLHLLLHRVVADLDVPRALVTRRRVVEGVDALHHVCLLELTADLGGGGALLDLVEHRSLARPRVVGRRSEPAAELAECPATGKGHDHDHDGQHDQHRTAPTTTPRPVDLGLLVRDAREELVLVVPVVEAVVWVEGGVRVGVQVGLQVGMVTRAGAGLAQRFRLLARGLGGDRLTGVPAGLPFPLEDSLQDHDGSSHVDHGPALLALPSLRPELPFGSHRAQALVVQPDRDRLHPVGQVTCERPHLTGRRSFTPGHRARQADVDADRAELVDERSQTIEVALAARHGLHRSGEDARRVAARDPDAGVAGVDPEAYAEELVAHQDRATRPDARQCRAGQPPGHPRPGWRRHRRPAPRRPCRRPCRRGSPRPHGRGCSPRFRRPGLRR